MLLLTKISLGRAVEVPILTIINKVIFITVHVMSINFFFLRHSNNYWQQQLRTDSS